MIPRFIDYLYNPHEAKRFEQLKDQLRKTQQELEKTLQELKARKLREMVVGHRRDDDQEG